MVLVEHRGGIGGQALHDRMVVTIVETGLNAVAVAPLPRQRLQVGVDDEARIAVAAVEDSADTHIADADAGRGKERHRAVDARQTPHVLVFQITAVAVFEHTDGELLGAGPGGWRMVRRVLPGGTLEQVVRDTELGGFHRAL